MVVPEALQVLPALPADLEAIFSTHQDDPVGSIQAFMPIFCDHIKADRIFVQCRNPDTRICKVMRWRRNEKIPWPAIPGSVTDDWFVENQWEVEDPLWRAALQLKPSIYIEDLQKAANEGLLSLNFENSYMFHTAFIHGHAHWPPLPSPETQSDPDAVKRKFYGSVQPAVFDGPRVWLPEIHELVEKCLIRIAPFMKQYGETAPNLGNQIGSEDKKYLP